MKSTDAPSKQAVPFGTNGSREAITATTPSGSNQASYDQGFPPITMTLKSAGGLPPKGQDMNQILFEQSSFNRYFAAGGGYVYDSTFSTAVGGYPLSARIPNSTGTGFWFNTVEDNQTNPENSTSALTGWIPMGSYGVTALTGLTSASVTLTALQASKERITLAGTLTANINIVVPAWIKRWEVVNNCTGAFTVTIKTPSGTGVAMASGTNINVMGDGVNVVASYSPGVLIGPPRVITSTSSYTPTAGTKYIIVEQCGAGAGGAPCAGTNANSASYSGGGGSGSYAKYRVDNLPASITCTVGVGGGSGVNGGATTFGSYCSTPGGNTGSNGTTGTQGIAGGGVGGGSVTLSGATNITNTVGASGSYATAINTAGGNGGHGGNSVLGLGGRGASNGGGTAAGGYGAGGGGCFLPQGGSTSAQAGGNGSGGVIIIWEYA